MPAFRNYAAGDFDGVLRVINAAAGAYRGVIPDDLWQEPYMGRAELRAEIATGVAFRLWLDDDGAIRGVMGAQPVIDVTLIRHAYVAPENQRQGIGSALLTELVSRIDGTILVGAWVAAGWAVSFYRRHGFRLVNEEEKALLLNKYWKIPKRQIEESVVLISGN